MGLTLTRQDITTMKTDAIVNAANSALLPGGGVCGAIFSAAGYEELERACAELGGCPTGQSVITEGFALPARYIVHTVGPIWRGGTQGEAALLESCYRSAIRCAREHGCASMAFPLIASGIYGYPKEEALRIAVETIAAEMGEMSIYLLLFDCPLVALAKQCYPVLWQEVCDRI